MKRLGLISLCLLLMLAGVWLGGVFHDDVSALVISYARFAFKTISIVGGVSIVADDSADVLLLEPGSGIAIVGNEGTDKIIISATGGTGGGGDAYLTIAAADTPVTLKARADYTCDGTNLTGGDQVEINAAFAAAKVVVLMPGTFWVSASITLDSNQTLMGSGAASILKVMDSHNEATDMLTCTSGDHDITVQALKLDGNAGNQASGVMDAIDFNEVPNGDGKIGCTIQEVIFEDWRNSGVRFDNVDYSTVADCLFENVEEGIALYTNSDENVFSGNIFRNGNDGILADGSKNNIATNNIWTDMTCSGINIVSGSHYWTISNNIAEGCGQGIYPGESNYTTIDGNNLFRNGYGVYVYDSDHCTITSNSIVASSYADDNTYDGIRVLTNSDYNLILGNTLRQGSETNQPKYGINIATNTCDNNFVFGNDLYDSGQTGDISDSGTGTLTRSNVLLAGTLQPIDISTDTNLVAGEGLALTGDSMSGEDASTANKGIAVFDPTYFSVTSGNVTWIGPGGTGNITELADLLLADTYIVVGDGTGHAAGVPMSQDATISSTGAITVVSAAGYFEVGGNLTVAENADVIGSITTLDGNIGTSFGDIYSMTGNIHAYIGNITTNGYLKLFAHPLQPLYGGTGQNSSGWNGFPFLTAGVWSALAQIDISSHTNLAATTPIVLTGDTLTHAAIDRLIQIKGASFTGNSTNGCVAASDVDFGSITLTVPQFDTATEDVANFDFDLPTDFGTGGNTTPVAYFRWLNTVASSGTSVGSVRMSTSILTIDSATWYSVTATWTVNDDKYPSDATPTHTAPITIYGSPAAGKPVVVQVRVEDTSTIDQDPYLDLFAISYKGL